MKFLISTNTLKTSVQDISKNIDDSTIVASLFDAQEIRLRDTIGGELLEHIKSGIVEGEGNTATLSMDTEEETLKYASLLTDYIHPYVTYLVKANLVLDTTFKVRNSGAVVGNMEHLQTLSLDDARQVKQEYENRASAMGIRLVKYLTENVREFPMFSTCKNYKYQPSISLYLD